LYEDPWGNARAGQANAFIPGEKEVIGQTITDSAGNMTFTPFECEFCQLDSAGNHAYNCPNRNIPNEINIPRSIEDETESVPAS
jgi:hypothetical protein